MNFQTINISNTTVPLHVLMDTKAPRQTEIAFRTNSEIQTKVRLYNQAIQAINEWAEDYLTVNTVITSDNPAKVPETLAALKAEMEETGNITIYSGACDKTVFSKNANIALRHLHDLQHIQFNRGMGFDDELWLGEQLASTVSSICCLWADSVEVSQVVYDIIKADFCGQSHYYKNHRKFVKNQKLFTQTVLFNDLSVFDCMTV